VSSFSVDARGAEGDDLEYWPVGRGECSLGLAAELKLTRQTDLFSKSGKMMLALVRYVCTCTYPWLRLAPSSTVRFLNKTSRISGVPMTASGFRYLVRGDRTARASYCSHMVALVCSSE